MRLADQSGRAKHAVARPRRCKVCRRPGPHHRRDWQGRCRTCAAYVRRTGQERPFVLDGRREARGQRVLPFACARPTHVHGRGLGQLPASSTPGGAYQASVCPAPCKLRTKADAAPRCAQISNGSVQAPMLPLRRRSVATSTASAVRRRTSARIRKGASPGNRAGPCSPIGSPLLNRVGFT